jgi:hypothetical protein
MLEERVGDVLKKSSPLVCYPVSIVILPIRVRTREAKPEEQAKKSPNFFKVGLSS